MASCFHRRIFPAFLLCLTLGLSLFEAALSPAMAGEYLVQVWGVDEGLPQSSVTDLRQTADGYLWIGTLLGGVSRFDGLRFDNLDAQKASMLNPGVRRLLSDSEGTLWVNDYGGNLLRSEDGKFIAESLKDVQLGSLVLDRTNRRVFAALDGELISGRRRAAGGDWSWVRIKPPHSGGNPNYVCDQDGVLWYRYPGSRLGRVADDRFELVEQPPGLVGKEIHTLAQGDSGKVWVGTDAELAWWNGKTFVPVVPTNGEPRLSVQQIVPGNDGRVWVDGNGRLRLLDQQQWSVEADGWDSRKLPWSRIRIMRSDNEGGLWVSLREEGLAHVRSDGSIHRITSAEGLPSQVVQAFFPDNEGNLWTGYHRGGLVRVRRSLFRTIARPEGLADTVVTSVAEDTGGAIWIGSSGGSVARWQEGHLTNFTLPLRGAFCQDSVVCAGVDGRVWVGTGGNGLLVFEDGKFRHVLLPGQLPQGVRSLLARRDGSVCYANFGGLFAVKDGKAVRMLEAKRTDDVPGALAEGPNDELWMGTLGGALMRMKDGKWEKFQPQDGRPASRFWSLWPEADGSIWIGTLDQGLLYFKDGKFTRFTRAEGLLDEGISQILSDGNDLWLGSRIGVLRVSRASLLRRVNHQVDTIGCRVFGRGNGLLTTAMALEFGPNCLRSRDGRLWFSSANGLAWTLPSDVGHRQIAPPVVIEKILADGKGIETSGVGGDLVPQAKGPLRLGPGVRNLEIHFTAPNLTAPELIEFRYRLQEVDGDWLDAGKHRSVVFTRLAPGAYTFDVSARNSDGIWSSAGATLHFVIVPHYWERRMFQAGVVILVVGLALLAIRVWTKRRMQHKLDRLERQRELERERTRIAQDLHDDLGAGLTEISLTSDLATNPELDASASAHYVTEIGSKARELVTTMDEIVWAVNPRNDSVASLAAYFCQFAQHLLKSSGIRCRLDVNESLPASPLRSEQRHQLFLAFKESLNNVVRHSGASEARLAIHVENGQLCLTLEDDGRGFGDGAGGVGSDGLRNMQDRLRRISGVCEVSSQPERGTKVVFRAPLPEAEQ